MSRALSVCGLRALRLWRLAAEQGSWARPLSPQTPSPQTLNPQTLNPQTLNSQTLNPHRSEPSAPSAPRRQELRGLGLRSQGLRGLGFGNQEELRSQGFGGQGLRSLGFGGQGLRGLGFRSQARCYSFGTISPARGQGAQIPRRVYQSHSKNPSGQDTGLFGVPGLFEPKDFLPLAQETRTRVLDLCEQAEGLTSDPPRLLLTLDEMSDALCLVMDAAELCRSICPSEQWMEAADEAYNTLGFLVQELNSRTSLYSSLVQALEGAEEQGLQLSEEQQRMAQLMKSDFERGGVHLDEAGRREVVQLQDNISRLTAQFHQNINTLTCPAVAIPTQFTRFLPPSVHMHLRKVPEDPGLMHLQVDRFVMKEVLRQTIEPNIRKAVYTAAQYDSGNLQVLENLLDSRKKLAKRMGFESFADFCISDKMANSPDQVQKMLGSLSKGLGAKASKELGVLSSLKSQFEGGESGQAGPITAWDKVLYTSIARGRDPGALQSLGQYLPLGRVLKGVSGLLQRVFGVEMKPVPLAPGEGWSPDVMKMKVLYHPEAGQAGAEEAEEIGDLYLDLHPRPGKFEGAAHFTIQCGRRLLDGSYRSPRVALVCNFHKPQGAQEAVLTHTDLETLLHECGHVLHSMLGRTTYQHLSGTRTAMDVVEVPSTLLEYFAWEPQFLKMFACHYQTGKSVPPEILEALPSSKNLFSGLETLQQVGYAAVDLELHRDDLHPNLDPETSGWTQKVVSEVYRHHYPIEHQEGSKWYAQFSHLGSYGSNYYSYMWCRVLSASIWRKHFQGDPLKEGAGRGLIRDFLAHGGAKDPQKMMAKLIQGSEGSNLQMDAQGEALVKELQGRVPVLGIQEEGATLQQAA